MADEIVVEDGTGLTNSNSYTSIDDADTYHENRLHVAVWTAANDSTKEAGLIWATKLLDQLVIWNGYKYDEDQALAWPRGGALDREQYAIDVDEIPVFLKDAQAEFARYLIAEDRTAEDDTRGFSRLRVWPLEMYINKHDRVGTIPDSVWDIIRFSCTKAKSQPRYVERA